jgi:hypothetical protein
MHHVVKRPAARNRGENNSGDCKRGSTECYTEKSRLQVAQDEQAVPAQVGGYAGTELVCTSGFEALVVVRFFINSRSG